MTAIYHSKYVSNEINTGKLFIKHFLGSDLREPEEKRRPERRGLEQKVLCLLGIKWTSTERRTHSSMELGEEGSLNKIRSCVLCLFSSLSKLFSAVKFLVLQAFLTTANLHLTESYSSIIPHVRSAPQMIVRSLRTPTAAVPMVPCKV